MWTMICTRLRWKRIEWARNARVQTLYLSNMDLTQLPAEIGQLDEI